MATMATLSYEFQGRQEAFSFVRGVARQLTQEPLETYPRRTLIPSTFDQKKIDHGLALLTPQTCIITLVAPPSLTQVTPDKQEKWLGGEYTIASLSKEQLTALADIDPSPHLGAPEANPFIPTHLKTPSGDTSAPIQQAIPLASSDRGTLHYAHDTYYHVPDISWIFSFKSPLIDDTPDQTALLDLYIIALNERLAPFLSNARRGGLSTSLSRSDYALDIAINGYAQKAPELLDVIIYGIKTVHPSQEEFARFKTTLLSKYENHMMAMPVSTANEIAASALYNNVNRAGTLHSALQDISYESFIAYNKALSQKGYIEGTISGSIAQKDAHAVWNKLETGLAYAPFPKEDHFQKEVLSITSPYRIDAATNMQGNAALLIVQQAPFSYQKKASQMTLAGILRMAFFETLRTKQQTGYIAQGWPREVAGELMQCFAVQSTTHEPSELIARFELFLEEFVRDFPTHVPEERFEEIRTQLITTLSTPATNLATRTAELHDLAYTYDGAFNRDAKLIKALQSLTYNDLKADATTFFSRNNKARLAIELEGAPAGGDTLRYQTVSADSLRREGNYTAM